MESMAYMLVSGLICVLLAQGAMAEDSSAEKDKVNMTCPYLKNVDEQSSAVWLANITNVETLQLTITVTFPQSKCCPSLVFYNQDNLEQLKADQTCQEKEDIVDQGDRVLLNEDLEGCTAVNISNVANYSCVLKKSFASTSTNESSWYVALSNCNSTMGLTASSVIIAEALGYEDSCPGSDTSSAGRVSSGIAVVIALISSFFFVSLKMSKDL